MDYLSAINNRQQSQGDNEYWTNLAAGNLSSGLGNTFGDIQSKLAEQGVSYETAMGAASGKLTEKISAATQKSTQAAIERGEMANAAMEAGGGILAMKGVAKAIPENYKKMKSSYQKYKDRRATAQDKAKTAEAERTEARGGSKEGTEGADYSKSAPEETENPLRHPLTTEEEPVARTAGGETEMANMGAEVRTGEATGHAATDVRSRPAAIGEEDTGSEIARQYETAGRGAETEMGEVSREATGETTSYTRATAADEGADVSRGVGVGEDFRPTNRSLGTRTDTLADRADARGMTEESAQSRAETAGQTAFEDAGGTGEIGSAAELPGAASSGAATAAEGAAGAVTGAAEEVGETAAKTGASSAAEGVGAAVGEAAAESATGALTEMAMGGFNVVSDVVGAGMLLAGVGDALYNALKGNSKAEHHEKRKEDKAKDAYNASANAAAAKQQDATTAANNAQTKAISDYHSTMSNMASSSHLAVTGGTEQVRNNSHAAAGTF